MNKIKLIRPMYAERFRCIGPACEDSCCIGWTVAIDRDSYEKYQAIPAGPLRSLIDANIVRAPENAAGARPGEFAQIRLTPPELRCPFLSHESLCRIQVERGEGFLSQVCSTFPRATHTIDGQVDRTLTLSCPEAARIVLLDPHLLVETVNAARPVPWDQAAADASAPRSYFWPIREFLIALIRNRSYPLWQRMFLLGTFCRRLEAIAHGQLDRGVSALLSDFSFAVAAGNLRASMEAIPADLALQLNTLVELLKLRVNNVQLSPRLMETLKAFIHAIQMETATTLDNQIARYGSAYRNYYAPFFEKHPYILENYLLNAIFGGLFPFGAKLFDPAAAQQPAREFALLATKFALIKGLLIGVAGFHREAFSAEHAVRTIQVVFKHFEHNPKQLDQAHQLLVSRGLDNARGLTMLLRN